MNPSAIGFEWPFVKEGSHVGLVAPSTLPLNDFPTLTEGIKASQDCIETLIEKFHTAGLKARFYGTLDPLASYQHYYAASTQARAQALADAIEDPNCTAVLMMRGGFGALEVLRHWETSSRDPFKKALKPKIIIGFSDATYILHKASLNGWPALHAPMGVDLTKRAAHVFPQLIDLLKGNLSHLTSEWEVPEAFQEFGKSSLRGPIRGGNLSVIQRQMGTKTSFGGGGKFVFIEDNEKDPKRQLDFFLHLLRFGALGTPQEPALALLLGYTPLSTLPGQSVEALMTETFEVYKTCLESYGLQMPLLYNPQFGHGSINHILPFGFLSKIYFPQTKRAIVEVSLQENETIEKN